MTQGIPVARRSTGRHMPLPLQRIPLEFSLQISEQQYAQLFHGMLSQGMEQKWQAYFEEPWIYLYRTTGVCVYAVRFARTESGYSAVQAFLNDNAAQSPGSMDLCFTAPAGHLAYIEILLQQVMHQGTAEPVSNALIETLNSARMQGLQEHKAGVPLLGFQSAEVAEDIDRRLLLGAIVGDVIGSSYEAVGQKSTDFALFTQWSKYTDDSVLTCAVAEAVLQQEPFAPVMRRWGRRHLMAGYGEGFERWIHDDAMGSYGSSGNGSAMRVAAVGLSASSREEVLETAKRSAECTHDHPEGIKGAQAIALAVWLARQGADKSVIRDQVVALTGYNLSRRLSDIRPEYGWSSSCADSVPESIICFLEAQNFEEAVRNAVSMGGDADTMAAMAGAIAAAYWGGVPAALVREVERRLSPDLLDAVNSFASRYPWHSAASTSLTPDSAAPVKVAISAETAQQRIAAIAANLGTVMHGQQGAIRKVIGAWMAGLHILLDDNPGTGKTTLAKALALSVEADFSRVQFTPDLLPGDIVGVSVFDAQTQKFRFHQGPVFANVLLADEINRASPRTQSALLEAMAEAQVTVDGERMKLPHPYLVIATQNPVDQAGTYPLPEAQMDRFGVRLALGYVSAEEELKLLDYSLSHHPLMQLKACATLEHLLAARAAAEQVRVAPALRAYIVALVQATRSHRSVHTGASPRASIALFQLARCLAFFDGQDHVTPDTIQEIAADVLAHRITLDAQARYSGVTGLAVVRDILAQVAVPV